MIECPVASFAGRTLTLGATLAALTAVPAAGAWAQTVEQCGFLGDRLRDLRDADSFALRGAPGERLVVALAPRDDARNEGRLVRLRLLRGPRVREAQVRAGPLPLQLESRLDGSGRSRVEVAQLVSRSPSRHLPAWVERWLGPLRARSYRGAYCLTVESSGGAAATLAARRDVELPWVALAEGAPALPPFTRPLQGAGGGRIQPEIPLVGGRVYGLIVTRGVRGLDGRPLGADADFHARLGGAAPDTGGPLALYREDVEDPANPFPDARLVRPGAIRLPDRVVLAGLDPADPALDAARARLRAIADDLERLVGFSTTAPLRMALSAPVDLATMTPEHVLLFERTDGALDLDGLVSEARRHGVDRADIALALSFPTQSIERDLGAARDRLLERAAAGALGLDFVDPDPGDDLEIGVFGPGDAPYADYLAGHPQVAAVAVGLLGSPDFRGADGTFDPAKLAGAVAADPAALDVVVTVPAGIPPPWPVVIAQHGFLGSNAFALDVGALLAPHGFATVGISALAHGRRGFALTLLTASPLQAREIFAQTVADQMALLRAIEHGVDVDGDGAADFDPAGVGYLGVSFGGLLGGTLVGVEREIGASVLNVTGGRVAFLGQAPGVRAIVEGLLAGAVGLAPGTPRFEAYLARLLELGELGQNPADPLNWARRYRKRPLGGAPPRRILLQEGEGDDLVINAFSEELAAVAGFATNTSAQDPEGVSGHWIFPPPGGHGIFALDAVRAQAARFLASRGTVLEAPEP